MVSFGFFWKGAKPKTLQHLLLAAFSQAKEKDEKDCTNIPGLMVLARLLASRLSFVFTFSISYSFVLDRKGEGGLSLPSSFLHWSSHLGWNTVSKLWVVVVINFIYLLLYTSLSRQYCNLDRFPYWKKNCYHVLFISSMVKIIGNKLL